VGASTAIFYAAGVVFAVSTGLMLLRDLWRTVSGQLSEAELVQVQESEDLAQIDELHLDRSQTFKQH
jgi:TRAP-type C4-dicarboxylate transport system permease small subunit